MNINPIKSTNVLSKNYSNINLKEENISTKEADVMSYLSTTPAALSFQATRRAPVKSLNLQSEKAQELVDAVLKRLTEYKKQKLKLDYKKPLEIKCKDENYWLTLNNTNPSSVKIKVKNQISSADNWSLLLDNQSFLEIAVNEEGKIVEGNLQRKVNNNFTKRFDYQKFSENVNRIKTNEGLTLQNARSGEKLTTRPDMCKNKISKEFDIYKDFPEFDSALSEIFFKLVQGCSLYA